MIRVCKPDGQIIIPDWQKKLKENLPDKVFIQIARITEDTPKYFMKILSNNGFKSDCRKQSYTYSIIIASKINKK